MSGHPQAGILHLPQQANDRAILCLRAAARLEERGDYHGARESLALFWQGPGTRPDCEGLDRETAAALILRAGSLTGWIGSKRQVEGWQSLAKDLLSESAAMFGAGLGQLEAQKHLGLCYWREGAFNEARVLFTEAANAATSGSELWAGLLMDLALVEFSETHYDGCLEIYAGIASACEGARPFVRGRFHNGRGIALRKLGHTDRAILELTAAAYYFAESGHALYHIATEINLSNLLSDAGQFDGAHGHLDEAERLSRLQSDQVHLAHAKDSRALVYLAEKNYQAAVTAARESTALLEQGDEHSLLVDSLVTQAKAEAALSESAALGTFVRAYEIAAARISGERAARIALLALGALAGGACLTGHLSWNEAQNCLEESVMSAALVATSGGITEAALRLGMKQQTFSWLLSKNHPALHPKPARKARRAAIMKPAGEKKQA